MCCGKKKMISRLFVEGKVLAGNACALREIAHAAGGTHLKWLFLRFAVGSALPRTGSARLFGDAGTQPRDHRLKILFCFGAHDALPGPSGHGDSGG